MIPRTILLKSLLGAACAIVTTTAASDYASAGTRAIVVDATTSSALSTELAQLQADYEDEGASVELIVVPQSQPFSSWQAHQWVRTRLRALPDLEGAILVGNVPTGFFGSSRAAASPSDIVYRAPNATLRDDNNDGVYEAFEGDTTTSIPVGRITMPDTNTFGSGPIEATRDYLQRIHDHRVGTLAHLPARALNFVDSPFGRGTARPGTAELQSVYPDGDVSTIVDPDYGFQNNVTTVAQYRSQLESSQGWEFVHVLAHSSPGAQAFYRVDGNRTQHPEGSVNSSDYRTWNPNVSFFAFESCSSCRFADTWRGYPTVSGEFICGSALQGGRTLGVLSPSQNAAMTNDATFYDALAIGSGMGAALNYWFNQRLADQDDPNGFGNNDMLAYSVHGDPWLGPDAAEMTAALRYVMLYYPSGSLKRTVESILSAIGIARTFPKKDVVFWTQNNALESLVAHYEIAVTKYVRFGTSPGFYWTFRFDVPVGNVEGSWGAYITGPAYAPRGNRYALRAVLKDGNVGPWTDTCRSTNSDGENQWTSCPQ